MNKQKLISFILKKETYKQLKATINEVGKQNLQVIKYSVGAIQQILTKQYNAESRLYALRFLKDCVEVGSKKFIKLTQQHILPIIVNIIIDSTDEAAITKYAGSSFTKTTDLQKFKSIIVSFFRLAKQCIMKWAQWIPSSQYKFKSAFVSLQKRGVRFQYQLKYFRQQNEINFYKNCKQNGFQTGAQKKNPTKDSNIPKTSLIQPSPASMKQQKLSEILGSNTQKFQISKRLGPKGKNKHIIECHQLFKTYDKKLKNGTISEMDIKQMNQKINDKLTEYMSIPDLNQNEMQAELQPIFQNIKFIKNDFVRMQHNSKQNLLQNPQIKPKNAMVKKTQSLDSVNKLNPPLSPINQLKNTERQTTKPLNQNCSAEYQIQGPQKQINKYKGQTFQKKQEIQIIGTKRRVRKSSLKSVKKQNITVIFQDNSQKQKAQPQISIENNRKQNMNNQVFQNDSSLIQSRIKSDKPQNSNKGLQKMAFKVIQTSRKSTQIIPQYSGKKNTLKQRQSQKSMSIQKSVSKQSKSNQNREVFDSNLDISGTESSRVNFTQSQNDSDSNEEDSKMGGNWRKAKDQLRLSSIAEQQQEGGYGQTSSRRNIAIFQKRSPRHNQSDKDHERSSIGIDPSQIKVPKSVIEDYQKKIINLEQKLQSKQSVQKQLQNRLNQLKGMKLTQQEQLEKIKEQNNKIRRQFSNTVNEKEYNQVRREFDGLKDKSKKMQNQMQKLLGQIQSLKQQQKTRKQEQMAHIKQNSILAKSKQPSKVFLGSQNPPRSSISQPQNRSIKQQKDKFYYQELDADYANNRTHLKRISQFLDQNNLALFKKNILGANQLFYNSEELSFICRTSLYKRQPLTLKLQLSFQFHSQKDSVPLIRIPNTEEVQVWKKNIVGQYSLYHQQIIVKLKKFPFKVMKIQVSNSGSLKKSVLLPFIYFSFLRRGQFKQEQFDNKLQRNKDSTIKSKVFNLNSKIAKDFKCLDLHEGFKLPSQNRMCSKLFQQTQRTNIFWCQLTNLTKQKCFIKIVPQPYSEEMYSKSQQLMENLIFLLG